MPNPLDAEVIVVGAGPSGATVAAALARRGRDVLLLDRHAFPRDKVCGDAISRDVVQMMRDLGMHDKVLAAEQRGEFYPLESLRLVSPRMQSVSWPFAPSEGTIQSYVAPRIYLDATFQQHAVDCGARFEVAQVTGPLFEGGVVAGVTVQSNGTTRTLRARAVVGADGVTSTIMRHLRPEAKQHEDRHRAVALRAYVEGLQFTPHEVEFILYEQMLPGYAWIFPAGPDLANVGLGMRLDHFRRLRGNLKKMLQEFLDFAPIRSRLRHHFVVRDVATWQLNFGSQPGLQCAYDGALLVGDAAGIINPLTGGGIYNGLVSSLLAAEVLDEALAVGDTSRANLRRFDERLNAEMSDQMRRAYLFQRLLNRFPLAVDFLIGRVAKRSGLSEIFLSKL